MKLIFACITCLIAACSSVAPMDNSTRDEVRVTPDDTANPRVVRFDVPTAMLMSLPGAHAPVTLEARINTRELAARELASRGYCPNGFTGPEGISFPGGDRGHSAFVVECRVLVDSVTCPDLSGKYELHGAWKASSEWQPEFPPRLDEFGFAFVARQVLDAKYVTVRFSPSDSTFQVDVLGSGRDARWEREGVPPLPVSRKATCTESGWQISWQVAGGGESTPSEMRLEMVLSREPDGSLISRGVRTIESGYIFKSTTRVRWVATFRQKPER